VAGRRSVAFIRSVIGRLAVAMFRSTLYLSCSSKWTGLCLRYLVVWTTVISVRLAFCLVFCCTTWLWVMVWWLHYSILRRILVFCLFSVQTL